MKKAFTLRCGVGPPNNSNTFIREMAREIGKDADSIGGLHPGNDKPQPVSYPGFYPWHNATQYQP